MEIGEVKARLAEIEDVLPEQIVVQFAELDTGDRDLQVYLTPQLRKNCKRKRVWKSKAFFITLKNIKYGIDPLTFKSKGGKDGIFVIDRNFRPRNEMQKKIFDQFIDKERSGYAEIAEALGFGKAPVSAVRVVSHHMRLLGIHQVQGDKDVLALVNFDDTKH